MDLIRFSSGNQCACVFSVILMVFASCGKVVEEKHSEIHTENHYSDDIPIAFSPDFVEFGLSEGCKMVVSANLNKEAQERGEIVSIIRIERFFNDYTTGVYALEKVLLESEGAVWESFDNDEISVEKLSNAQFSVSIREDLQYKKTRSYVIVFGYPGYSGEVVLVGKPL